MHWNLEQILCKFQLQSETERERDTERGRESERAHAGKPEANPGAPLPTRAYWKAAKKEAKDAV